MKRTLGVIPSVLAASLLGAMVFLGTPECIAQTDSAQKPQSRVGLPEDWSHRHLVFSKAQINNGKTASKDARLYQQWARRQIEPLRTRGPIRRPVGNSSEHRDWSYYLGSTSGASMAPGTYPAKYTFDVTAAPSCTNDFVVYTLNKAGSTSQPSIMAFNNLYSGGGTSAVATASVTGVPITNQTLVFNNPALGTKLTLTAGATGNAGITRSANSSTQAANIATAINRTGNGSSVGISATASGSAVTVTATKGTAGNNITITNGLSGVSWTTFIGGLDAGICGSGAPSVMWAYDGLTTPVLTSPVLSLDGTEVVFVEQGTAGATLHVLRWKQGQGTTPAASVPVGTTVASTAAGAASTWSKCLAGSGSCMFNVVFANGKNDSRSSPFYDYSSDMLYVGDDSGVLHKFSGVFTGTPAEVVSGNWPITVDSGYQLTGPVLDPTSRNIYVGDANGHLSYVRETGSTTGTCSSGSAPCVGTPVQALAGAIVDTPLVDSSAQKVFGFEGTDATNNGTVYQFDTALSAASKRSVVVGHYYSGYAQSYIYTGTFDDTYFESANSTGYLYVCGKDTANTRFDSPALHRIAITNGTMATTSGGSLTLTSASGEECSAVTEFYNSTTNTDWLFFSVGNLANQSVCGAAGGGCIMSLNLTAQGTTWPPAAVTAGYATPAGPVNATTSTHQSSTSGIVVDNVSASGQASSIYFSTTGATTCGTAGGNNVSGCAVKLTQSGLQ